MIDHPLISKGFKSTFIGAASVLIAAALGAISLTSITAGIVVGAATELFGIAVETGIRKITGQNEPQSAPLLVQIVDYASSGVSSVLMATTFGAACCLTTGIMTGIVAGAAAGILAAVALGLVLTAAKIVYAVVMAIVESIKERSTDDKQALPA